MWKELPQRKEFAHTGAQAGCSVARMTLRNVKGVSEIKSKDLVIDKQEGQAVGRTGDDEHSWEDLGEPHGRKIMAYWTLGVRPRQGLPGNT